MDVGSAFFDSFLKTANLMHRALLEMSGGRLGNAFKSMPVVQLHTTGRTSGKRRSVMLTSPIHGDGRYVLVASKGGDDRHPEWYLNVVADPDVELTVDGKTLLMRARTANPDERAEMWPSVVAAHDGYGEYQERTEREIPLVVCEPRPA